MLRAELTNCLRKVEWSTSASLFSWGFFPPGNPQFCSCFLRQQEDLASVNLEDSCPEETGLSWGAPKPVMCCFCLVPISVG